MAEIRRISPIQKSLAMRRLWTLSFPPMDQQNILFLDKVLTKPLKEERLRGVEVFNVYFVRDLIRLNHRVTLIIHPSWQNILKKELPVSENLTILESSKIGGKNLGSLAPLWKIRKHSFDSLFLANVGDGILIPYHFIQLTKLAKRTVLLAHKVPGSFFVKNLRSNTRVVSVNRTISKPFEEKGFAVTDVYYGILNSDQFYPEEKPVDDGKIRFGMLGDLDSHWKGSDVAIEAFLKLPPELAEKSELHLAAFNHNPPEIEDPRIVIHQWIDRDRVGDYLRNLDIMLTLSRDLGCMMETFCQTMVQGMLCGLPQISTPLEIFTEKLDAGGGIVAHNTDEVVNAMVELANNPEERSKKGAIAASTAKEHYVWNSEYFLGKYFGESVS